MADWGPGEKRSGGKGGEKFKRQRNRSMPYLHVCLLSKKKRGLKKRLSVNIATGEARANHTMYTATIVPQKERRNKGAQLIDLKAAQWV